MAFWSLEQESSVVVGSESGSSLAFGDMPHSHLLSESYGVVEKTASVKAKRIICNKHIFTDLLSSIFCSFHNLIVRYLQLHMLTKFCIKQSLSCYSSCSAVLL